MSLKKRIANSAWLNRRVVGLCAAYLRLCHATIRWDRQGFEDLREALSGGAPVIMLLWHERIALTPWMFDFEAGRICSLTSDARAGRLAGQIQAAFGFETVAMRSRKSNLSLSREVVKKMRSGVSIGIAGDGPRGPRREMKTVPLEWSRATGAPIFLVTFAATRMHDLNTWDKMRLTLPFGRGIIRMKRWETEVPRRLQPSELEVLRQRLEGDLTRFSDECDVDLNKSS